MKVLTFEKSSIWPDNSKIEWTYEGIGQVGPKPFKNQPKFQLHTNDDFHTEDSVFVEVINPFDYGDRIMSPIFWSATEWAKQHKNDPKKAIKNQYHSARQAAMQWCEQYYETYIEPRLKQGLSFYQFQLPKPEFQIS